MNHSTFSGKVGRRLAFLILGISVFIISCSSESKPAFPWTDRSGKKLAFSAKYSMPADSVAAFSSKHLKNSFILQEAVQPEMESSLVCSLDVKKEQVEITVSVFDAHSRLLREAKLLASAGTYAFCLPLEAGKPVKAVGIAVSGSQNQNTEEPAFILESLAFADFFSGYLKDASSRIRISSDFQYLRTEKGVDWSMSMPLQHAALKASFLHVEYNSSARGTVFVDRLKNGKFLRGNLEKASTSNMIPLSLLDTTHGKLRVVSSDPDAISACYIQTADSIEDIPLDAGLVLQASDPMGGADFLAYRWKAQPSVVIFDFASYDIQDAYLKRLAFFVEKKGFVGRLAKDAEIANLHGWNAHDYKAEDIARFFAEAERLGFSLNEQELKLREFLLKKGILAKNGGKIEPGRGAIVSISRESADYLRYTFLNHELTHAIFFTDNEYRDFTLRLWNDMDRKEQWFWFLYFGWMNYNIGSSYLMANEMQAYLMQQPVFKAEEYFTKTLPKRLYEKYPELEKDVTAYMAVYGSQFARKASALESFLKQKYGFSAGKLLVFTAADSF